MGLLIAPLVNDYAIWEKTKVIYSNYSFNCPKYWKDNKNSYFIYKADKYGIEKIYDSEIYSNDQKIDIAIDLVANGITDNLIVSGGHTVIDLSNRLNVGSEAVKSTEFTLQLISKIQKQKKIYARFLIQLNDLYMEKDSETSEGTVPNKYRKQALKPYIIPCQINKLLKNYSKELNRELQLYYCSEKNLADSFKRYIKNKKKNASDLFFQVVTGEGNTWNMLVDSKVIPVLINDKPNCIAANAAMLRVIRYSIENNKQKDNFTSYVGVFPVCSLNNVLNGYKVANKIYNLDLPSYYIFTGRSCF